MRIPEPLQPLHDEGVIQEVLRPLMSGKEAQIYLVMAGGIRCVAKVYKEAEHRSFKNRADYTEGRKVRNSRQQRAMEKGSRYGKAEVEEAWRSAEVDAIYRLRAADVRVPEPYTYVDGVLVMELVTDAEGEPAPRMADLAFTEDEAEWLFHHLVREVCKMLCAGVVHGDLSDFNVLMSGDGPVIIDFPQATDPAHNNNARKLLIRDVNNLTMFLERYAPSLRGTKYGEEMWDLFERGVLAPETPLTGKFKKSDRSTDVEAILREIEHAEREARARREALGLPPPRLARTPVISDAPPPKPAPPGKGGKGRGDAPRGDAPRGDAPRGDRPPREDRGPREDRPPREDRGPREDRPPRGFDGPPRGSDDRAPRGERPPARGFDDRGPREDRPARDDRPPRGERPPRDDRAPRGFEGPSDRPARGFEDRPPRDDRAPRGFDGAPDRPARGFDDRPRDDRAPRGFDGPSDRPARGFDDRPPRGERGPRGFDGPSDRPPRAFDDRPPREDRGRDDRAPRGFDDRPPREDRGRDDRPPRAFDDRPPRGERPPRDDRRGGFDAPPARGFEDRPRDDRPPRDDRRGFDAPADRPPRDDRRGGFDAPTDRPPRGERPARDDRPPRGGDRPPRNFEDRPAFEDRPPRGERPARGDAPVRDRLRGVEVPGLESEPRGAFVGGGGRTRDLHRGFDARDVRPPRGDRPLRDDPPREERPPQRPAREDRAPREDRPPREERPAPPKRAPFSGESRHSERPAPNASPWDDFDDLLKIED